MRHHTAQSLRGFGGRTPRLGARVLIDPSAVVLGDVELGDDVSIWPQVAVRGDMHRIRVGARTSVQDEVVIGAGALVTPGKHLRSGYLYAGSPAREMRELDRGERDYFGYSADNYVRLKDRHIAALEEGPG